MQKQVMSNHPSLGSCRRTGGCRCCLPLEEIRICPSRSHWVSTRWAVLPGLLLSWGWLCSLSSCRWIAVSGDLCCYGCFRLCLHVSRQPPEVSEAAPGVPRPPGCGFVGCVLMSVLASETIKMNCSLSTPRTVGPLCKPVLDLAPLRGVFQPPPVLVFLHELEVSQVEWTATLPLVRRL